MPLKQVVYMSRKEAEEELGQPDWAIISLSEPDTGPAHLKSGWHSVLRLEFHDIDVAQEPYTLFSGDLAREIVQFVEQIHAEPVAGLVVHCRAGISRSAAVARWVADRYGLYFPSQYILYNKHVYRVLRNCGNDYADYHQ